MECLSGMLRGIGNSLAPMIISVGGVCGLRIIWIFVFFPLEKFHTLRGIYLSYPITWIFCITALSVVLMREMSKKIKKQRLFESIFTQGNMGVSSFFITLLASIILGVLFALVCSYKSKSSKSFYITTALVPACVTLVIMLVNGNIGAGIAVAFVATIYGLFAANLLMIPLSTRIKFIYQNVFLYKNMILEGVLSIQAGESPVLIERKLRSFILEDNKAETKANG